MEFGRPYFFPDSSGGLIPPDGPPIISASSTDSNQSTEESHRVSHDAFRQTIDFRDLSEHGLESPLRHLISIEDRLFDGQNTAEHKLGFLLGGAENDTTTATTSDGSWVMARKTVDGQERKPRLPRSPEILEAVALMSPYFDRVEEGYYSDKPDERFRDEVRILSEIADVAFNLFALREKDSTLQKSYKNYITRLSKSLGFETNRELLLMALVKYNSRYVILGKKNHEAEERLIADLLLVHNGNQPNIIMPSDDNFGNAFRWLNRMGIYFLSPRVGQIPMEEVYDDDQNNAASLLS